MTPTAPSARVTDEFRAWQDRCGYNVTHRPTCEECAELMRKAWDASRLAALAPSDEVRQELPVEPTAIGLMREIKATRPQQFAVSGAGVEILAYIDLLRARVERLVGERDGALEEAQQCHAKATCCCGDYVKGHGGYEHAPVSMYDYALANAEGSIDALKSRVTELERRIDAAGKRCGDGKALHTRWRDGREKDSGEVIEQMEHVFYSVRCYLEGIPGQYLPTESSILATAPGEGSGR